MLEQILTERDRAKLYHRLLPDEIRRYLNRRGIPDGIINRQLLGWNGRRITIPIFGRDGDILFCRFAKAPDDRSDTAKVLSPVGSKIELYGWETLAREPLRVVVCEGEFDRLVLEARGFPAVTSTGGAGIFLKAWAPFFANIPDVFICFDRDAAGEAGAANVKSVLPHAHVVRLPSEIGEKGDITDYFVRLRKSRASFGNLLAGAAAEDSAPAEKKPTSDESTRRHKSVESRANRLKKSVRLREIVERYLELRPSGSHLVGHCPFHSDGRPSFTVYPATDTYCCFGCNASGDVISFLMKRESITFGQALDALERYTHTHELFPKAS